MYGGRVRAPTSKPAHRVRLFQPRRYASPPARVRSSWCDCNGKAVQKKTQRAAGTGCVKVIVLTITPAWRENSRPQTNSSKGNGMSLKVLILGVNGFIGN